MQLGYTVGSRPTSSLLFARSDRARQEVTRREIESQKSYYTTNNTMKETTTHSKFHEHPTEKEIERAGQNQHSSEAKPRPIDKTDRLAEFNALQENNADLNVRQLWRLLQEVYAAKQATKEIQEARVFNQYLLTNLGEQTVRYEELFSKVLEGALDCHAVATEQLGAVQWADALHKFSMVFDLEAYESIVQKNLPASITRIAEARAEAHKLALAEPLVERVRLAYLYVYAGEHELAYEIIEEAANVSVSERALEIPKIAKLYEGVKALRDIAKLGLEPLCLDILFNECDLDQDGYITRSDLDTATRGQRQVPRAVYKFLNRNFEAIRKCKSHDTQPARNDAITREMLCEHMSSEWLYDEFKNLMCA